MEKRYQVFVSSTYEDLKGERQKVIQSLLEFNCIPVGMEFFPAADDSAWEVIKKVIEDSDYYLVIVAGKYGSLTPEGISYTQKEYEYAIKIGIPVISFLHGDPGKIIAEKSETDSKSKTMLESFRDICQDNKLCKYWNTDDELAGAVLTSINQLIKTKPRIGWVRANKVPDESTTKTILDLKEENEQLKEFKNNHFSIIPEEIEDLAQGEDLFEVRINFVYKNSESEIEKQADKLPKELVFKKSWNQLFITIAPSLSDIINEDTLKHKILTITSDEELKELLSSKYYNIESIYLQDECFNQILLQFRALGLIMRDENYELNNKSKTPWGFESIDKHWRLTPLGEKLYLNLFSIKKIK